MKILTCVLTAMMAVSSFANADEASNKPQKIYVDPSDVQVAEEGILVTLQDQVVLVKNLRSDRRGFFVLDSEMHSIEKRLHRCYCHNPECPRGTFIATKWRKYCSEPCEYEHIHRKYR